MPYTHGLLGSLPRLDSDGGERLRQIPGSPPSMVGDHDGLPVRPPLPDARRHLRRRRARALGRAAPARGRSGPRPATGRRPDDVLGTSTDHMAACHFADQVIRLPIASMFPDTSADQEGVAP